MASIKLDGPEILDSSHIPEFVKHETAPDRSHMTVALARQDGEILIAEATDPNDHALTFWITSRKVLAVGVPLSGANQAK